jgi:hypothetical protein
VFNKDTRINTLYKEQVGEISGSHGGMKMIIFWDVSPCRLIESHRRFNGSCYHHQSIALMMEAVSTSESL